MNYPVAKPDVSKKEIDAVTKALKGGWVSSQGPQVRELEEKFAKFVGTNYAVACSSGTTALTLALRAAGIREGDEVIVPEFTMIASAWAVTYTGATPVFVDCGEDLNINPHLIEEKITSRTRAIMPVHIYGRMCNMAAINKIAYQYNLIVVEDCAEALGAEGSGSSGDLGCFSLFANKNITAGEGGLITTNNKKYYEQLQHLKAMAFDPEHTFYHPKLGYNFRMTNMQAAFALAQLERIDELLKKRDKILEWYDEKLENYTIPRRKGDVLWMYDMLYEDRDGLMDYLSVNGIETRMFFKPMSCQPMYRGDYEFLQANQASSVGLYLPTYTELTKKDVDYITSKVLKYIHDKK